MAGILLVRVLFPLAALAVYAWLTPPVSGMGDASELTLVLATLGVAHPTGYPLYVLAGHLFGSLLHASGVGWPLAAALWSAAGAATALAFLLALALRLSTATAGDSPKPAPWPAALIPLSLFALQPILVAEATRAEVNSWSLAWVCGAGYLFVRLVEALAAGDRTPTRSARGAALWGLACGVGLAHHLTSILVSAPLSLGLLVVMARRRRLAPCPVAAAAGVALLPLSSYAFIAWRAWHPAPAQWALLEPSLASVIAHVTGAQYRHFVGYFAPTPPQRELLAGVAYPFLGVGVLLLFLGLWRAKDAEWRIAWSALAAAALLSAGFAFRYGVHDPAPYFLPAMALGAAAATPAIASLGRPPGGAAALGALALVSLIAVVPWLRDGRAEREATLDYERTIRSMWSAIPPDTAIVCWADDRFHRLREYQILRGEKPALLVVTPDLFFARQVRETIRRRFGADPLEGFRPPRVTPGAPDEREVIERHRMALVQGLSARIRVPVILFDPAKPIVFQLRKPWEPAVAPAAGAERRR